MSYIKIFLSEIYELNKRDFWIINGILIVAHLILKFFDLNELVQAGIIIILGLKVLSFLRSASVQPSISSDFDRYSWKYFQGLPLSKKELLLALSLTNTFIMLPVVFWLLAFLPQIAALFNFEKSLHWYTSIFVLASALPLFFILSLKSISNVILFPRKQYSKVDPKIRLLYKLRNWLMGSVAILYVGLAYREYLTRMEFNPLLEFLHFVSNLYDQAKYWMVIPFLCFFAIQIFHSTIHKWQHEKIGYSNIIWNWKRDSSIMVLACLLLVLPFKQMDLTTPNEYAGIELSSQIYDNNLDKIENLIAKNVDINQKNKFGFSPIMVAIDMGNFRIYNNLKNKGASLEGIINKNEPIHKGMDVFHLAVHGGNEDIVEDLIRQGYHANMLNVTKMNYPLHVAAAKCDAKMVDKLLSLHADLNAIDKNGRTALHISTANSRCFSTVAILLDAGADLKIKDKSNKLALEYLMNNYYGDNKYYLEKKTRSPASKE